MNLNDLFTEEKVRLDPKCWTGKKIGNPKTKMKGGTRVNNCVPAESVEEDLSRRGFLKGLGAAAIAISPAFKAMAQDYNLTDKEITMLSIVFDAYWVCLNYPKTTDPEKCNRIKQGISEYAKKRTFTSQELNLLYSSATSQNSEKIKDKKWLEIINYSYNAGEGVLRELNQMRPFESVEQGVAEGLTEMDKSQTPSGRDGSNDSDASKKEYTAKATTPKKVAKDAEKILNKELNKKQGVAEEGERSRGRPMTGDWDPTSGKVGRVEKTPTGVRHHADPSRYGGTENNPELDRLDKGAVNKMDNALGVKWDRESKRYFSPIKVDETKPKEKEADYGDDYQDMVARVKKLAGLGPLKTVYDPTKRVYRNVPTAVQPKK